MCPMLLTTGRQEALGYPQTNSEKPTNEVYTVNTGFCVGGREYLVA